VKFVQLRHLHFLVSAFNFLPLTFDILDILFWLGLLLPLLSLLLSVLLFCIKLESLIFIEPRNSLNIDFMLLEGINSFPKNLFYSRNSEQEKGIGNLTNIYILELKDIPKVMLFVCSDV